MVGVAAPLSAQASLRVNVLRPLAFDRLAPGMPQGARAGSAPSDTGVFEVLGPPGALVELWFTLPAVFDGPRGEPLPVFFDATSAALSAAQSLADRAPFDPRLRQQYRIPASGRFLVFIAGRVAVRDGQSPGRYRASIVLFANEVL